MSKSLEILRTINDQILNDQTFHHHYHILYDIADELNTDFKYLEIGAYAGGSACLMSLHPNCKHIVSIDLGTPILPTVAINNVHKCNPNCLYDYIQGNSQSHEMYELVKNTIGVVDILFIDGDHSYQGVINDFLLYENLVRPGGYIIFDDYMDSKYSPEVKSAVDGLVSTYGELYEIIGTIANSTGARPSDMQINNEFVIRKK